MISAAIAVWLLSAAPPPDSEAEARALLQQRDTGEGRYVVLARRGVVRLTPDGPAVGAELAQQPLPALLLRRVGNGEPVRVISSDLGVRVLLYVDPADFGAALRRPTKLSAAPGKPAPATGVELGGSAPLEVLERREGWARVRTPPPDELLDAAETFTGWVPDEALGGEVEVSPFAAVDGERLRPRRGAVLRATPGGRALARFLAVDVPWDVVALGEPAKGARQVTYESRCPSHAWRVTAWLSRRDTQPVPNTSGGGGCSSAVWPLQWGPGREAPRVSVPRGSWLHDAASGALIGFAFVDAKLPKGEGETAWLPTPWGALPVTVR